jgi:gliding motility-associated-like protein
MNKHCFGKNAIILFMLAASLSFTQSFGQPVTSSYNTTNWRFSNPKPFGFTPFDVDFFDNNIAVAVGSDGGIARTTDGGLTWTYGAFTFQNAAGVTQKATMNDVHFVSANIVYAVGAPGCMAKSTDGGVSWSFLRTPLYANGININAVWFTDDNRGYIGGAWNTADSIPKLYFTNDGGANWDSLVSPTGGKVRMGYISNPNLAPIITDITGKGKEIYHIEFTSPTTGYICGSGQSHFPPIPAANATTCLPTGGTTVTSANNAALVWKYSNGVLTDFSLSKERLGYSGINTNTITCTTQFNAAQIAPVVQTYRAMNIINDSLIVLMSFNNNTVVRVYTGVNDNTTNLATGLSERGRYQIMSFPFPPTGGPQAGPPIPNPQVLFASNPYHMKRNAAGKLYATGNFGRFWTSVDTGRNWVQLNSLPPGNFSNNGTWALDIAPNGKMLTLGTNGAWAHSSDNGNTWGSNYSFPVSGGYVKIEFADCNNGMTAGGGSIAVTNDGGKTWFDRTRTDFVNLNIQINSFAYVNRNPSRAYFATSTGTIYSATNMNAVPPATPTLDPVYANSGFIMNDVAAVGIDSAWACGRTAFSVPAASSTSNVFRTTNGGTSWTQVGGFPTGTLSQFFSDIEFPTKDIGYVCGTRDTIWKTTNGGVSWFKLPLPTPGVTPQISYSDMQALDANTVFLTGFGFPRKVVYKTTDGGNTWQDITSNIAAIYPVGNLNGVLFHDANNGYVVGPGGALLITNNGGASWRLDVAPSSSLYSTMSFAPPAVPNGTPFTNRRMFVTGPTLPNSPGHILEYGGLAILNVSSAEATTTSCNNASNGSITITAAGGIAPYTYNVDGGAFQSSNTFNGLSGGSHTITVRDFACGLLTKTVTVGLRPAPTVNAGPDFNIVEGDDVMLNGSTSSGTPNSVIWAPATTLTGAATFTPVAKPPVTTNYTMTVTGPNGCISSDDARVNVIPYCVKIMNAKWLVTNGAACTSRFAVAVYNRYGNVVYKNDNYNNDWTGTYNGKAVADGTYYYAITYTTITGRTIFMRGDVTILR